MKFLLIFVATFLLINFIADGIIYRRLKNYYSKKLRILHVTLSATFMIAICAVLFCHIIHVALPPSFVAWFLWTIVTILLTKALFVIINFVARIFSKKESKVPEVVALCLSTLFFALLWCDALTVRDQIKVNEVSIEFDNLPSEFDGYKLAQISDIHLSEFTKSTFIHNLVDSINHRNPDLIVFSGDLVIRQSEEAMPFKDALRRLNATDGIYSVLGNHDYCTYAEWSTPYEQQNDFNRLKDFEVLELNWNLLNNEHVAITRNGSEIQLIGVENWGEYPFPKHGDIKLAYPNANDSAFKILLSHNPKHWDKVVVPETNIDLTLSGHTHAMQTVLNLFNHKYSPSAWIYKEWGGLYTMGKQRLYVNIGCGNVGYPVRIGSATPEITLITLRKKRSNNNGN